MRLVGVVLLLLGLVAAVVGVFSGVGSLFSWNGRHAIEVLPLSDAPSSRTFVPTPGRHYTISVQIVFDREGLEMREGVVAVDAKMPLAVRVKDSAGTSLADLTGWVDPNEPPNVLYGHAAHESRGGPAPELTVERLIGPFGAASAAPLAIQVDLGPDRVKSARIAERRLVIYDDALPRSIRNAFLAAALGGLASLVGGVFAVLGWLRRPRRSAVPRRQQARRVPSA